MRVEHDSGAGRLRLDTEAADALLAAARDEGAVVDAAVADLLASGVVDPVLHAVRTASATLRLRVAGERVAQRHDVWVAPEVAGLRLDVTAGVHQVMAVEPAFLAAGLARLVRLGPRRVGPRTARPVGRHLVAGVLHDDPVRRADALHAVGATFAWALSVEGLPDAPSMTVLDGPHGAYVVAGAELRPVSATWLWRHHVAVTRGSVQ